ncbi:Lysine exporter protein LysE/YggA [Sulfitobacter noctilucae]|uniref:LysE family translocator n=1 Tax=Sulfitobacter noctilucae TaxID=1342302 RepID=UPI0004682C91|nr:LysE family translocator [Sulfitobacter noctilucae]KIN60181.1 Lysine exporter protein LysE/YggA [Sulfitobacter noctilucae]
MEPFALAIFAAALILNAGTPGPSIAALVSRVISRGWADVAPFVAAMWIGEIIWLSLAMAGLSALAETFHGAFLILKYLGVAYLIYLAWKMWTEPVNTDESSLPKRQSAGSMFFAGFALTLGNPKIMVFYLALLPSLIDLTQPSLGLWAIIAAVTVASLAAVDLFWIALAHHARSFLKTPKAIRVANRVGATALGGAAGVIASR